MSPTRPSRREDEVTLPLGESARKAGEGLHHTGSFQSAARLRIQSNCVDDQLTFWNQAQPERAQQQCW